MNIKLIEFKVTPYKDAYRHVFKYFYNSEEYQVNIEDYDVIDYKELLIKVLTHHNKC